MKVRLSMSVYNRKEVLSVSMESLRKVNLLDRFEVVLYDDCSTEFDVDYLHQIAPFAARIHRNKTNLRADGNMIAVYRDFLKSDADYLLQIDTDVLFNEDILRVAWDICNSGEKNAVYSFYNSNSHLFIANTAPKELAGYTFGQKRDIGAVCVLFPRCIVQGIVSNLIVENDDYHCFDFRWSHWLVQQGIPIWVSEESLVQHIGFVGQNSSLSYDGWIDIGHGFKATNQEDQVYLLSLLQHSFVELMLCARTPIVYYRRYRKVLRILESIRVSAKNIKLSLWKIKQKALGRKIEDI